MDEIGSRNVTSSEMRDNLIFVLTVYIPLDLVIIFGNAFVLFVIRRTPSLDEPQFLLLGSLAFVDLLTGLIAVPMFMWACITRESLYLQNIDECELQYIPTKMFISLSFLHLLFITTDRYISIMKPLRYPQIVTRTRIYRAIVSSWIISSVYGVIQLFWPTTRIDGRFLCHQMDRRGIAVQRYMALVIASTVTILLIIMYFRIFKEVKKHERSIANVSVGTQTTAVHRKRFKAAKTSALIVCAFGVAYLPHSFRVVFFSLGFERSDIYWYDLISEVLITMNSAVNPLIYMCRLGQFAYALRRLFRNTKINTETSATNL